MPRPSRAQPLQDSMIWSKDSWESRAASVSSMRKTKVPPVSGVGPVNGHVRTMPRRVPVGEGRSGRERRHRWQFHHDLSTSGGCCIADGWARCDARRWRGYAECITGIGPRRIHRSPRRTPCPFVFRLPSLPHRLPEVDRHHDRGRRADDRRGWRNGLRDGPEVADAMKVRSTTACSATSRPGWSRASRCDRRVPEASLRLGRGCLPGAPRGLGPALEAIAHLVRPGAPIIVPTRRAVPDDPGKFDHPVIEVPSLRGTRARLGAAGPVDPRIRAARGRAGLVILCNPWNPVGRVTA